MGVHKQFIAFRRKACSGLIAQRLCHPIIEGVRSEDRFCQSGAWDGKVEKRHCGGDWMVLPDPFHPVSRAGLSSHKIWKDVEYESVFPKEPRKHGKGRANVGQMLDHVVGEDNIKTSFRQFSKFIKTVDQIEAQLCPAKLCARP